MSTVLEPNVFGIHGFSLFFVAYVFDHGAAVGEKFDLDLAVVKINGAASAALILCAVWLIYVFYFSVSLAFVS